MWCMVKAHENLLWLQIVKRQGSLEDGTNRMQNLKKRRREIRRQKYMVPINTHIWIGKQMDKRNLTDQINCKRGRVGF